VSQSIIEQIKSARRAATPLLAVNTPDPRALMSFVQRSYKTTSESKEGDGEKVPMMEWDILNGLRGRNDAGKVIIDALLVKMTPEGEADAPPRTVTKNFITMCEMMNHLPKQSGAVIFVVNAQRQFDEIQKIQAIANIRDSLAAKPAMFVMLGPRFRLPPELANDVITLEEPLPNDDQLRGIVKTILTRGKVDFDTKLVIDTVNGLRGLPAFMTEQTLAMSIVNPGVASKARIELATVNELTDRMISDTRGLSVYHGPEEWDLVGGCGQVKEGMLGVIEGLERPQVLVLIDEGEKMFAGATGAIQDNTGVSQDILATFLTNMEDNEADGTVYYGVQGAAKSLMAKVMAKKAGIKLLKLDIGAVKEGTVGATEHNIREAFKVINAVGGGRVFFIMTCNKLVELPTELQRRFTSGIYFFDLPTKEERATIWPVYMKRYNISYEDNTFGDEGVPIAFSDDAWTGAEIRNVCRLAYRQSKTLANASKFIVPVSRSSGKQIEEMRKGAHMKYLSAGYPGIYKYSKATQEEAPTIATSEEWPDQLGADRAFLSDEQE
jgi:hypothetical protein